MIVRRLFAGFGAVVLSAAATVTLAESATAATVRIGYDLNGTTHVAKSNSSMTLGPGTLTTDYDLTEKTLNNGDVSLPPAVSKFKVLALIPVEATVNFEPAGKASGQLENGVITANSQLTLRLSNVKTAGIPTDVGPNCRTSSPAALSLSSPEGQLFNPLKGGTLTGKYTIPDFTDCGLTTALINALVPGPGNTVSLTLSNGHRV